MLKQKRLEKGLTLSELAKKVGKSESYISRLERRNFNNVTIKMCLKLSQELELPPVEVFLFFAEIEFNKLHNKRN